MSWIDKIKSKANLKKGGSKSADLWAECRGCKDNIFIAELEKKHKTDVVETGTGLRYIVLKKGSGDPPDKGVTIHVHYTGALADGTKFGSSRLEPLLPLSIPAGGFPHPDRGVPLKFPVGKRRVILGWDEALSQMKKGEQRILIIPHKLAYGERGRGGVIPPFATLVYDVALVDF